MLVLRDGKGGGEFTFERADEIRVALLVKVWQSTAGLNATDDNG